MSNAQEKRDKDEYYLYAQAEKIGRRPTEAQVESFCERVAIMIADGEVEESTARRLAFKEVMGGN